ncbi:PIN domain-containing protein [Aggregatilineales bacterium SYSU G02658]
MMIFIDTNILIDISRRYPPSIAWYRQQSRLFITTVTALELIEGTTNKATLAAAINLLRQFELVYLTAVDQEWALQMQRRFCLSHNVELTDCLIAAACARTRAPLYTRNLKHMRPLLGDLAVSPYL